MSWEDSAGPSGPRTPPAPGELKPSAGGIWCLTKQTTKSIVKKESGRCFDFVTSSTDSITFGGNESRLALVTGSSRVHSFDVKQVVLTGLQENLLLAAFDARDGPGIHQREGG